MLGQLVSNLLSNAGRHTKNGEITISLTQEGNRLITTVADTGEGIDPAMLPRIFERGASGDGSTGYGLSICKTVVETHGGEIRIESEPGKGTAARFTLPIRGEVWA
jgi:signal transduction histidine kinase